MRQGTGARAVCFLVLAAGSACDGESPLVPPALTAICSAAPASGTAPLAVNFLLNVAGAEGAFTVSISYGDGSSGGDAGAQHTYRNAGAYTVTFTVRSASQSALCSTVVTVTPPSPPPLPPLNQPPIAVFKTTPPAGAGGLIAGRASLAVTFNLCASTDPEQDVLYFTMDFQGDGAFDTGGTTGAQCRRTFVYSVGTYRPRICVTDLDAASAPAHPYECQTYTVRADP